MTWCIAGNSADPKVTETKFEWLRDFSKIIVTGPQRSGTRICAKMIAHDTRHRYVDESEIGVDSLYRLWSLLRNERRFVVQCPALCRHVHLFGSADTAIVLMRRDVKDIVAFGIITPRTIISIRYLAFVIVIPFKRVLDTFRHRSNMLSYVY